MTIGLQVIISGLAAGGVYGLFAAGYSLIYRLTGIVHFAFGDLVGLGIFTTLLVFGGTTPPAPTLTGVNATPDTATLAPGATRQFSATGTYSDGTSQPVTAAWSATGGMVSTSGLYTAPAAAGCTARWAPAR